MFLPVKSDNGAVLPWEYMPAEKGTYQAGQLLAADATTGHLEAIAADLTTTPPYLCMADITVETAGTPIPVTRVSRACIYETTLSGAATGAVVGTKLQVESGGLQASKPAAGSGTFEVVFLSGAADGDTVRGRWVDPAPAAGGGGGGG